MADDKVSIAAPTQTVASTPIYIKTFSALDVNGNLVEIQALVLTNENGRTISPLTEETGREILNMLQSINNILADYTGCGVNK